MIDIVQFRQYVIRPTLVHLGLGGLAAENLLLGTALTESGLMWLRQVPGPALGVYQCEPATYHDLWANWLAGRKPLELLTRELMSGQDEWEQLVTNLAFATAICRLHYYRRPEALPAADDARGLAEYHKQWYNTPLGATDPKESVVNFERAIRA